MMPRKSVNLGSILVSELMGFFSKYFAHHRMCVYVCMYICTYVHTYILYVCILVIYVYWLCVCH